MNGEVQFLSIRWHTYLRVREFLAVLRVPLITIFSVFTQGLWLKEKRSSWVKPIKREFESITLAQQITLTSPKDIPKEQLARRLMLASPADTRLKKRSAFPRQKYITFLFGDPFSLFSGAFLFLLSTFWLVAFSAFPSFISTSFACSSFPLLPSPLSLSSSSSFCTLASSSISDKQAESCYVIIEFQLDTQSNLHTTQLHKLPSQLQG